MTDIHINDSAANLVIKAGPEALKRIHSEGFRAELFTHVAAAAGGPKWLALNRLHRTLFGDWLNSPSEPLIGIGSSIGAWCLACAAQDDPDAAFDRFEAAYLAQSYSEKPDAVEVAEEAARILDVFLDTSAQDEIFDSRRIRLNIVTAHGFGLLGASSSLLQSLGVLRLIAANSISRRYYAKHLQRVLFHAPGMPASYADDGFHTQRVVLNHANIKAALLGTAAIPLVIAPVKDISGGPRGTYLDGGLIDYHMDLPLAAPKGLLLLPHFSERVITGWFDRWFKSRTPENLDHTVLLAPSPALLERLPNGKVPDRKDFPKYGTDNEARVRDWKIAISECQRMADDWQAWLASNEIEARIQPL